MTLKTEMHPKILERRMAVGMGKLQTVSSQPKPRNGTIAPHW